LFLNKYKFSESKETRRRLIWSLFQQLLDQNRDVFGDNKKTFTYDCATLLYSISDLGMKPGAKREFVLNVDRVFIFNIMMGIFDETRKVYGT